MEHLALNNLLLKHIFLFLHILYNFQQLLINSLNLQIQRLEDLRLYNQYYDIVSMTYIRHQVAVTSCG